MLRREFLAASSSSLLTKGDVPKVRLQLLIDELENECRRQYPEMKQFEVRMSQSGNVPLMIVAFR